MTSRSSASPHAATAGPDEPASDPERDEKMETFVIFSVDSHGYALPIAQVRHVLPLPPLTRIPTDAAHVLGVFHHQGKVLALWDLHTLFGADGPPPTRPAVVVVEEGPRAVGLLVEHVDEVVTLLEPEVVAASDVILAPHVQHAVLGWLRAREPEEDPRESSGDPRHPDADALHSILTSTGRPDRGAAVLALHAPVHLLDPTRLWAIGSGEAPRAAASAAEVADGRS